MVRHQIKKQVANKLLYFIFFLGLGCCTSCSLVRESRKQADAIEEIQVELRQLEEEVRNIKKTMAVLHDTVDALFLYEYSINAFIEGGDAEVQSGCLVKVSDVFNLKSYDTVYSFDLVLQYDLDPYLVRLLNEEIVFNTGLFETELRSNQYKGGNNTTSAYCEAKYILCRAKLILSKGSFHKRRVPYLTDCDALNKIKRTKLFTYSENTVWTRDILGVLDYEILNVNDYNIDFK